MRRSKSLFKKSKYLSGPVVAGFYGLFEDDYGETSSTMPRVTPSRIGKTILPFRCPKKDCGAVIDFCELERHHDDRPGHDNYWCPTCRSRFLVVKEGMPLDRDLLPGSVVGPSRVERGGEVEVQDSVGLLDKIFGKPKRVIVGLDELAMPSPTIRWR